MVRGITTGLVASCFCHGQGEGAARIQVGQSELEVTRTGGTGALTPAELIEWVKQCAAAVARYFGRFPVIRARLEIAVREGGRGVSGGRTWSEHGAHTRISMGQRTNVDDLQHDWVLTHEFVHYGFPDMPDRHHWIEEGLATYVEPIARVAVGTQDASTAWFEMVRDMPQGQPKAGDQGLDHTHTWGRTYWGGALFCLVADVTIRKNTENAKGLRDALRGIVAQGGNIEVAWPIERALETGDRAVGGNTLVSLYDQMGAKATPVDLDGLWKELGVERQGDTVVFNDRAPLSAVRRAILS